MGDLPALFLTFLTDDKLRIFWYKTIAAQKPGPDRDEFKEIQGTDEAETTKILERGRSLLIVEFMRRGMSLPS